MKTTALLLAPLVAAAMAVPIGAAALVTVVAAPAADQQLRTVSCAGDPAPPTAPAESTRPADPTATPTPSAASSAPVDSPSPPDSPPPGVEEGGVGFPLPPPGTPRRDSIGRPAAPIPPAIDALYRAAAARYALPWTLLAGIGMAETDHGRTTATDGTATSTAGAVGLMQFLPTTWAVMGVDGDHDQIADIRDDADSVFSAANYLTRSGATHGPDGVRRALFAYNHATWYINDVLEWAQQYATGPRDLLVLGNPTDCGTGNGAGAGNPALPPLTGQRIATLLAWAQGQLGEPYVFGADGPDAWDCSSFTRAAYARIGISLPRTAASQRDWLAAGNGFRVPAEHEQPGDLVFTDTYLGPNAIGHVMLVFNPAGHTSIEAGGDHVGHYDYARYARHAIFQIWRVGNVGDQPNATG